MISVDHWDGVDLYEVTLKFHINVTRRSHEDNVPSGKPGVLRLFQPHARSEPTPHTTALFTGLNELWQFSITNRANTTGTAPYIANS